jgi:hypothetical protein
MLPDTGERYLTAPLFDGIDAEMNERGTRAFTGDAVCAVSVGMTALDRPSAESRVRRESLDPEDWDEALQDQKRGWTLPIA